MRFTLAHDSAIMRLPFIGFSFSVIGRPTAGVIKKQLGEVDPERRGSGSGLCGEDEGTF